MKRNIDADANGATATPTIRLLLTKKTAGAVIGKAGANITRIREQSGCNIQLTDLSTPVGFSDRVLTVSGGETEAAARALELVIETIEGEQAEPPESSATRAAQLLISQHEAGRVIGRGGATIKVIREESQASVQLLQDQPEGGHSRVVELNGPPAAVMHAINAILNIIAAMPPERNLPSKRPHLAEAGAPVYYAPPPNPYAAVPGYPGLPAAVSGPPPPTYGAPPPASYGALPNAYQPAGTAYPPALQHYPPPAAPPGFSADEASGDGAVLTQLISADVAGRLIGKGGETIKEIRAGCRSRIQVTNDSVAGPDIGVDYRKLVVTGSLEDIHHAIGAILQRFPGLNARTTTK